MKFVELPRGDLTGDGHGSHSVEMCQLVRLKDACELRVHVAWCRPGGVIGCHRAGLYQLFAVVSGAGWVGDGSGPRIPISAGDAVLWVPGELHESGSDSGIVVAIVASAYSPIEA